MIKMISFLSLHCNNRAVSHIFFSLSSQLKGEQIYTKMLAPSCSVFCRGNDFIEAIHPCLQKFLYRTADAPRKYSEKYLLNHLKEYDTAYLWPCFALETARKAKQYIKTVFVERWNCHQGKALTILSDLYAPFGGIPKDLNITKAKINRDIAELKEVDFVFCPSPEVKKSILEIGIPECKLISSSYGWEASRFPNLMQASNRKEGLTVIFIGSICIRKGAHILLSAWEKAAIRGTLILYGSLEPIIAEICSDILTRSDVQHVPYTSDLSNAYTQADLFAFPSFEEGGPLVTYEAMAHGLPILTSSMGAGSIMRHNLDGLIVSPYEEEAWVESLRLFAKNSDLLAQYGASARQRAQDFTWDKVAARRASQIVERVKL